MTKLFKLITFSLFLSILLGCDSNGQGGQAAQQSLGDSITQVSISRIDQMPNLPQPYKMLDWRQKALSFDQYAFDFDTRINGSPTIWLDYAGRNIKQVTFGLYTAVNDCRQGPNNNNGEFHESLNSLAAILGAGLVGIDKTAQDGYNYVKMVQNYFNSENGWNIIMNNTCPEVALLGGGYGRDWWYDVFPNVLYYAVCDVFPDVEGAEAIQRSIAEQFYAADYVLDGNYDYSYFDYSAMQGVVNHIPLQQDAAGGHAYVLYAAYQKFGDQKYLEGAKSTMDADLKAQYVGECKYHRALAYFTLEKKEKGKKEKRKKEKGKRKKEKRKKRKRKKGKRKKEKGSKKRRPKPPTDY